MSIGVEKVHGGVIGGQWTEGDLVYVVVTGPTDAFAGSYGLTPTEKGPRPAPKSAAEAVYKALSDFGTPVIMELVSETEIHVALAYATDLGLSLGPAVTPAPTPAANIEERLQAFGTLAVQKFGGTAVQGTDDDLVEVTVDFSGATVEVGDFRVEV